MALDMRALYYIMLTGKGTNGDNLLDDEHIKANENMLNQNFSILTNKIYEFESRMELLERGFVGGDE